MATQGGAVAIDWNSWVPPASVIGGFATGLAAGVAIIALFAAAVQIIAGQKASREAGALQAYRDYLRLCFDNPDLTSSLMFAQFHAEDCRSYINGGYTLVSERYEWMLSILLNTCEEVLTNVSSVGGWRSVLVAQIRYHEMTVGVLWGKIGTHYDAGVHRLVREALTGKRVLTRRETVRVKLRSLFDSPTNDPLLPEGYTTRMPSINARARDDAGA